MSGEAKKEGLTGEQVYILKLEEDLKTIHLEMSRLTGCATDGSNAVQMVEAFRANKRRERDELVQALHHLAGIFAAIVPNHAEWGDYKAALAAIAKARSGS